MASSDPKVFAPTEGGVGQRVNLLTYLHLHRIVNGTGVGRVARHLTEELARNPEINMHILAESACHARVQGDLREPLLSIPYHLFRTNFRRQQLKWLAGQGPFAEEFWPECSVVWCPAESYVPVKSAALIVTVHDLAYFEDNIVGAWKDIWLQRLKWQFLFGVLARKADIFHVVSAFSAERLAHFYPSVSSRIRIVPNALTPRFLEPVSAEGESALEQLSLGKRYILLPGGLSWKKNADAVVAAWPQIRQHLGDVELAVVGPSHASYAGSMAREPGVRMLGFVDDELLVSLYARASVVWVPSRYEGFAIPILEAMACGVPVVAARAGAIPEVAGDAALLAPADSPRAHVDAIIALLGNERLRLDLRNRGLQRVGRFSWKSSAEKMLDIIKTVSHSGCAN
jgi:glycosyltransferase involved in cell wall biosynthesis